MSGSEFTVCIPVYNGGDYLERVVGSCCLAEHPWLNVLVVDNASNDDTALICSNLGSSFENFRFLRFEDHLDAIGNWNRCVENCNTELLCFVCCDDLVLPEGMKEAVDVLGGDSNIGFVCCSVIAISPEGDVFKQNPSGHFSRESSKGHSLKGRHELLAEGVSISGLIMRLSLLKEAGSFSKDFELITEFILPQLFVRKSEFEILDVETGVFLPRKGSTYSRKMGDRVLSDLGCGMSLIRKKIPVLRDSEVISRSFASIILRNIISRGPVSLRQSIALLKMYWICFKRLPVKLWIGVPGLWFTRGEGWFFEKLLHFFKRKKYCAKDDVSPQTMRHIERFVEVKRHTEQD